MIATPGSQPGCPNHLESAADQTCSTCERRLCSSCVVPIAGRLLCAPCKEERIREIKSGVPAAREGLYFPVSITKLVVLSVATLGIYELVWFYKQWKAIKLRDRSAIRPLARALFGYFYCRSLFADVNRAAQGGQGVEEIAAGPLTLAWIVLTLASRLPEPLSLISALSVLPLVPVQRAINQLNAQVAPDHDRNGRFTGWNIATLIVSALAWALIVWGTSLMTPALDQ